MKKFFRVALSLGVLAGLVLLERKRPLRRERESKFRRNGRNLAVAALGALTVQLLEAPASPASCAIGGETKARPAETAESSTTA